jgi:hypothetical protein
MFIANYHETDEGFPLVFNLGRFSLEWNMVEQFFTALIWEYLGDHQTGMAVTGGMGNQSRADVLLGLARQRNENPDLIDRVEFACKAFNILRENRNMLMHSHSIYPDEAGGKPHWRRATGKGPHGHVSCEANFEDLERLIAQTSALGFFVIALTPIINPRNKKKFALPEKFPLPIILTKPPSEGRPAPPPKRKVKSAKKPHTTG